MKNMYGKYYSKESLWKKLKTFSRQAGAKVVYVVLLLYYTLQDEKLGIKTRLTIIAALGYFIFPADAIPDLTPLIGFSDDLGVLLFALHQLTDAITEKTRQKARQKVKEWFGEDPSDSLSEIDQEIFE